MFDIISYKNEPFQIMDIRPCNPSYPASIWKNIVVHRAQTKNLRRSNGDEELAINIWNIDNLLNEKVWELESNFGEQLKNDY